MAFCSIEPSLELLPSQDDNDFSHISLHHIEAGVQTDQLYQIVISRDIYTQQDIDDIQNGHHSTSAKDTKRKKCRLSKQRCWSMLDFFLPLITAIRKYDIKLNIIGDILSGVSVACLHFPQGLAYGILASLSPVQGLYTSFFPVLFYVLFGTVQHMAIGTDSIVAIMVAEIVETEAERKYTQVDNGSVTINPAVTDNDILNYKISVSMTITLSCGLILLAMTLLRLGFLTTYQSKSFIGGFTTAAAFHIFTSQVPKALGITVPLVKGIGKMVKLYISIVENISETNLASVIVVLLCVVFIAFVKDFINARYREKMKFSIPADLVAIIIATTVSKLASLHEKYDIELVGEIPSGIPSPSVPSFENFTSIFSQSFQIAVLIFFLSIAMVNVCAEKHEYEVDDNKEMMAYGLTNLGCAFFPCFPPSTSPPRNMILSSMGAVTTLNGVFTAIVMALVLLILGELFSSLPVPALAAMIFVSVKPLLLQVVNLKEIFRINKFDFVIWIVSCMSGILIDLPYGLICGIGVSFLTVIIQNQITISNVEPLYYHSDFDLFVSKKSKQCYDKIHMKHISICRLNTCLYFATTDGFRRSLYNATVNPLLIPHSSSSTSVLTFNGSVPPNRKESGKFDSISNSKTDPEPDSVKVIILDCSSVTYLDIQGINTLSVVFEEYRRVGITVLLARCNTYMWNTLKKSHFFDVVSPERVFHDVEDAFHAAKMLLV